MSIQNILISITTIIFSVVISYNLVVVSRNIGYEYGSKKREMSAVCLTAFYVGILTVSTRISHEVLNFKDELYFSLFLIVSIISISSSFVDLKYKEIPNSYNLSTAIVGIITFFIFPSFIDTAILSGGLMFGIYFLLMIVTNALGGGDVKMAGALGLIIPFSYFRFLLISPFAFGTVIAVYLIFVKKRGKDETIAFGPYITLGYLFTTFLYWVVF